ncbi:MAG: helix-turn-helix domain-containing protein [Bacteroidales bacterium]|nr:helix-turn-helix domain-containing protein [Bacteroidales bacterium]
MKFNVEKLKAIAKPASPEAMAALEFDIENSDWILESISIAMNIRSLLKDKGISQTQLAEKLNVSKGQVSKLLSGRENFSLKTISRLEKALDTKLISVISPNDKRPKPYPIEEENSASLFVAEP